MPQVPPKLARLADGVMEQDEVFVANSQRLRSYVNLPGANPRFSHSYRRH